MNWLAVVVSQGQPPSHILAESPKTVAYALSGRLQSLESRAALGGMDADQFQRAMIDSEKYGGVAFHDGKRCGHVRAPHLVHALRLDRPVMGLGAVTLSMTTKPLALNDPGY